jgi:serine/threonine protein kinase
MFFIEQHQGLNMWSTEVINHKTQRLEALSKHINVLMEDVQNNLEFHGSLSDDEDSCQHNIAYQFYKIEIQRLKGIKDALIDVISRCSHKNFNNRPQTSEDYSVMLSDILNSNQFSLTEWISHIDPNWMESYMLTLKTIQHCEETDLSIPSNLHEYQILLQSNISRRGKIHA